MLGARRKRISTAFATRPKEVVADLTLENRILKKNTIGVGDAHE